MEEKTRTASKGRSVALYFLLVALQTVGAVILLANIVPLYRLMALDFSNYRPDASPWWAFLGLVLIQVAYWVRTQLQPPLPRRRNLVLGHMLLFTARLTFVSVTASFTVMFLNRFEALRSMNYPPLRVFVVLAIFFSVFCWTLELERLAKALQESHHES